MIEGKVVRSYIGHEGHGSSGLAILIKGDSIDCPLTGNGNIEVELVLIELDAVWSREIQGAWGMEIDEDLGLASCGADAPDNTYKGVREIEVAVIVGSHAVEPCTHGESCKDLFGLIRGHHIDYGILSNRIIGDIQTACAAVYSH